MWTEQWRELPEKKMDTNIQRQTEMKDEEMYLLSVCQSASSQLSSFLKPQGILALRAYKSPFYPIVVKPTAVNFCFLQAMNPGQHSLILSQST